MCGIFGTFENSQASTDVFLGLHAQQHRAVEYAGMASSDRHRLYRFTGQGIVQDAFDAESLAYLRGPHCLGHIRYATTTEEDGRLDNTHPVSGIAGGTPFMLAHNGNLTNVAVLRAQLAGRTTLATSLDTELIVRRMELVEIYHWHERIRLALRDVTGSYSLAILLPDRIFVVRDPWGNRPLSLGRRGDAWFVTSETVAFDTVGAQFHSDVEANEIIEISREGIQRTALFPDSEEEEARCVFEQIYYAAPASRVFGVSTAKFRYELGIALEHECPAVGADVVIPVPDSSNWIGVGFGSSGRSGRFAPAISRNHYIGRTFIEGLQSKRDIKVRRKFHPIAEYIAGKKVVLVDDSIVRLSTLPSLVQLIRSMGPREVHVRIGAPPIAHPCFYGIDTPTKEELGINKYGIPKMQEIIGADTLKYLSLEALKRLAGDRGNCFACMDGNYPIPLAT